MNKKVRPIIKQRTKIHSTLQQEIDSICPLCDNTDVGHFEIHHIDENPENNKIVNLFLLCPTCHSKITKGDISRKEVEDVKRTLPVRRQIECASITIDSENCSWKTYDNITNAFIDRRTNKSPFPILNFSLINHSLETVLFTEIQLKAKHLYSGLAGIPQPRFLKSIAKFKIQVPNENATTEFKLINEIEVPSGQAFKFQVQLYTHRDNENFPIDGRKVLYFTFKFNKNVSVKAPIVFLNCKSENEKMQIRILY